MEERDKKQQKETVKVQFDKIYKQIDKTKRTAKDNILNTSTAYCVIANELYLKKLCAYHYWAQTLYYHELNIPFFCSMIAWLTTINLFKSLKTYQK